MPNDSGVTEVPCTVGHHCPAGTAVPLPCDHGTYMNMTGPSSAGTAHLGVWEVIMFTSKSILLFFNWDIL